MADDCLACGDFVSRTTGGSQVFMTMVVPQLYRIPVQVGPGSNFEAREYVCPLNNCTFKVKKSGKGVEAYDESGFKAQVVDVSLMQDDELMQFEACNASCDALKDDNDDKDEKVHKGTKVDDSNVFSARYDNLLNDQVIRGDVYF